MGRTEGRSSADTKRMLLDAATRVIRRDGLAASLDDIATEAGVSKGGLTYHYRSKQVLLIALGDHLTEEFRHEVEQALEPDDGRAGRLNRAYVRASFAQAGDPATMRDNVVLAAHLISDAELSSLAAQDGERWRIALLADGLPSSTVTLIMAATDGASSGALWGSTLDTSDLADLERTLLALATPA
jgi:AcrR family transcriptional regulator